MAEAGRVDPEVTVVVPTLNEADHIARCLTSLAAQTVRPVRALVVDGGSGDDTVAIAQRTAADLGLPLTVLDNPARRVPHALNVALRECSTPFLLRVDAHATINPTYVEVVTGALRAGHAGAGGVKLAVADTSQGRANATALGSRLGVGGSRYHYASERQEADHVPYGGYRTERAREIGGWDEALPVNQDFDFDVRLRAAGGSICLDPDAVISWRCRETLRGHFAQYRRYGWGKAAVLRKHPGSADPRHVLPGAFVGGIVLLAAGSPLSRRVRRLLGLTGATYATVLLTGGAIAARGTSASGPRVALSIGAMHVGYGVGLWEGAWGRSPRTSQVADADGDAS